MKPLELSHGDSKRCAKVLEFGHVVIHDAKILVWDHGCLNLEHLEVLMHSYYEHYVLRHVILGFDGFLMHFVSWSADHWSG